MKSLILYITSRARAWKVLEQTEAVLQLQYSIGFCQRLSQILNPFQDQEVVDCIQV